MSERSRLRLFVLRMLVLSLLATLVGRLWYLQVLSGDTYTKAAANLSTRDIVTAPARGDILDDRGRPLARNRTALVVSVNRIALLRQPQDGAAVLHRLAKVVHVRYVQLHRRITPCGHNVPKPCWNGSPYQPIPVTDRANTRMARMILERQEDFPGVSAEVEAIRQYPRPGRANAAHLLGYLRPVTRQDLSHGSSGVEVHGSDLVGATGLEKEYDNALRGRAGLHTVSVDALGGVTGTLAQSPPKPGADVVTSIDAGVQHDLEKALKQAVASARTRRDTSGSPQDNPLYGTYYKADSAAGVVLDVRTGHVIALASLPTYNPNVWVGGISQKQFKHLQSAKAGVPSLDRATQGDYAPGSTFKLITTAGVVKEGRASFSGTYYCPGALMVGNSLKHNFEGEYGGYLSMHQTIVESCDTVYYGFAIKDWEHDQRLVKENRKPVEGVQHMARDFGLGRPTGIDLPTDHAGLIEDRKTRLHEWKSFIRKNACAGAKRRKKGSYLQRIDAENCKDGWVWRLGDQANLDIGQGTVLVTPLQLAVAYEALVNGGKVRAPRIAKAIVAANGHVIRRLHSKVTGHLPVSQTTLNDIMSAMYGVTHESKGTASGTFSGFPFHKVDVGGKTGTADVSGKQPTSWFASFGGPAGQKPRYVVLAMVTQAGQGALTAAPAVRQVWEGIYGLNGHKAALPGGLAPSKLPKIKPDGTIVTPHPSATPDSGSSPSPSTTPSAAALPAYRRDERRTRA